MRVRYVSRDCSPSTTGGTGTYVSNVLKAMLQSGHEVTLVSDFLGHARRERAEADFRLMMEPG